MNHDVLTIEAHGRSVLLGLGGRMVPLELDKKPLLWGIDRLANVRGGLRGINVRLKDVSFSTTRQIVATVNTLAWCLGILVNGKRSIRPRYDRDPNITKQKQ